MRFKASYVALIICLLLTLALPESRVRHGVALTLAAPFRMVSFVCSWPFCRKATLDAALRQSSLLAFENARMREQLLAREVPFEEGALAAHVIFRGLPNYNSSLWVDVGERDNKRLGRVIASKNSPVLAGSSLVGVIDYVGSTSSRVRLISDTSLTPSVRAARGGDPDRLLCEQLLAVEEAIEQRALLDTEESCLIMQRNLDILREKLNPEAQTLYLAKGILQGADGTVWRGLAVALRGIGFNQDYPDALGPARDLRSGRPYGESQRPAVDILKPGDLLITTGMDGIFPAGLDVAIVQEVDSLEEGDYFYTLRARPTAGNFDELRDLLVLAPLQEPSDLKQQQSER